MTKPLLHKYDYIHIYYYNSTSFIILYGYLYIIEQRYNMINKFVAQQLLSLFTKTATVRYHHLTVKIRTILRKKRLPTSSIQIAGRSLSSLLSLMLLLIDDDEEDEGR